MKSEWLDWMGPRRSTTSNPAMGWLPPVDQVVQGPALAPPGMGNPQLLWAEHILEDPAQLY